MREFSRSKLLLLLLCLFGLLAYAYWPKPVTQSQLVLYSDVFCLTLEGSNSVDKQTLIQLMEKRVQNNASSYALKKQKFNQKAAMMIIDQWQAMSPKLQAKAQQGREVCRQLLAQ